MDIKRVLNVGSGPATNGRLHGAFLGEAWKEVRLDIDSRVAPDLVGTIQNMKGLIEDGSFDAIWSSHNIEHLHTHEVMPALREFHRILKPDGFGLITCPDLDAIARQILEHGLDTEAYMSKAGPITASDMIFGHAASIAVGNLFMCHKTGFTAHTLGACALQAGFAEARVAPGKAFDLWAVVTMPESDLAAIRQWLAATPEAFLI